MSFAIVVTYRAQEGAAGEVRAHLDQMLAPTRAEPGCRSYDVYASTTDEGVFVLVEVYDDEAAFEAHRNTEHFAAHVLNGAMPLLAQRDVIRAAPLG